MNRIEREKLTVQTMIKMFCTKEHKTTNQLCADCQDLRDYALKRLENCKFQMDKPTCGRCKIHCYRPDNREKIRKVMRVIGPKMVFRHPIMAISHLLSI